MTAAQISMRGDLDQFNLAKFLWGMHQRKETGFDLKKIWGPESFEYGYYTKAQSELNGQDGGFLAPEEWRMQFTDIIRDESALRQGTKIQYQTTPNRTMHLPVAMSELTWTYQADNVNLGAGSYSTRKFAQRTVTLRKALTIQQFSTELFRDASAFSNAVLVKSLAGSIAFEQDARTLVGTGQGGQPTGVLNATNVTVANLNATPTTANLATGVANAMNLNGSANVPVGSTPNIVAVTAPRLVLTVGSITAAGALPWQFGLGPQASQNFMGVPWVLTNAVPIIGSGTSPTGGSQSFIFYGDWRFCMVVTSAAIAFDLSAPMGNSDPMNGSLTTQPMRVSGQDSVVASRSADFANDQIDVKAIFRYDVVLLHPEAFFVHAGLNQ